MANTKIPSELVAINAISGTLIADNAITAVHVAQNQIHSVQLAINSVTATQIADGTITSAKIADGTIVTADIADGQITTGKIADSSVTTGKIAAGTILGGDIANNAILTQHIDDNQITADQIADNAVGLGQLASLSRGSLIYGNSAGNPAYLAAGTSGHVLTSDGTDISWTADTDLFLATTGGTVTGNILIDSSSSASITLDRGNDTSGSTVDFKTGGTLKWYMGLRGLSNDNFYLRNQAGSTDALTILTNGKVGIGQTNPQFNLDVTGLIRATSDVYFQGDVYVDAKIRHNGDVDNYITFSAADTQGFITGNSTRLQITNSLVRFNQENSNQDFSVYSANSDNMLYVDASTDRVGIGTDSPDRNLHIETAGDSYLRVSGNRGNANDLHVGNIEFENTFGSAGVIAEMKAITGNSGTQSTKGQLAFYTDDGSTYAERMRIDSSGHVGIGISPTFTPGGSRRLLQITNGSNGANISMSNNSNESENPRIFSNADNLGFATATTGGGIMEFYTGGAEVLRITSTKNLQFIGKTTTFESPGFTYHTNNYLYLKGGTAGLIMGDDSGINTVRVADGSSGYFMVETGDGTERMRIDSAGDIRFAANATGGALIKGVSGNQTDRNTGGYPQFTFVGNEGTGMRRVSSNVLAFDNSGAESLRIDSDGDVLIGQTSQTGYAFAQKLVVGDGDANDGITIQSGSTHQGNLAFNHSDGTTAHGRISYQHQTNYMQLFTNNEERMRIDNAGTMTLRADGAANLGRLQFSSQANTYQLLGGNYIGYMGYKTGGYHRWFGSDTAEDMRINNSGDLIVQGGAVHIEGRHISGTQGAYKKSMKLGTGGNDLYDYERYYESWNTSTETINVFETSHDTANWGEKYIKITVRQSLYNGGGYAEFYLNHQYNTNSLQIMHGGNKYGSNSSMTAQMTSLTTVTGNVKKSTFQLVMGYYQHAYVTVQSNMTTSTSITAANQLKFF